MRHAILILAHKNISQLIHLIEYFSRDCYVFVHIDKKSKITKDEIKTLEAMPQVRKVYRKYSVHWGGFSMLKCEMFLLRKSVKLCDADYFHLLSGQDYPIKSLSYMLAFFEKNKNKEFFDLVHLPHPNWDKNTFYRFQFFYPYDWLSRGEKADKFIQKLIKWEKKFGFKRRIPDYFDHLYGNSQWFSITCDSVKLLLKYTHSHPAFYHKLHYTFAPEESYISTVLVNLLPHDHISYKNFRYVRWKSENGSYPANFGYEHFHLLIEHDALFARKFDVPDGLPVINLIDNYLLKDSTLTISETGGWRYDGFAKYTYDESLADAIARIGIDINVESAVDMGCGAGSYVAALRRRKIAISGYDANPYTKKLSSLLLPKNDELCDFADLTESLEFDSSFDLVLCLDVLPYIPRKFENMVINNLAKLSGKCIILSWALPEQNREGYINKHTCDEVKKIFKHQKFTLNEAYTKQIRRSTKLSYLQTSLWVFDNEQWGEKI